MIRTPARPVRAGRLLLMCCTALAIVFPQSGLGATEIRVGTSNVDDPIRLVFHDLVNHIGAVEGWDIEWVHDEPAALRAAARSGEIDLLAAVPLTGEDGLVISHEPVLSTWGQLFVRSDSPIGSVLDLEGRAVAGLEDDPYLAELRDIARRFGVECDFVVASDSAAVLTAVVEQFVDAGVVERSYGLERAAQAGLAPSPVVFAPSEVRFAAPVEREGLVRTIDFHMAQMRSDPSSVYHQAVAEHLGPDAERRLPRWILPASGVATLLIVVLLGRMMVLRRRVSSASRQLAAMDDALADEIRTRRGTEAALLRFTTVIEQMVEGVAIADADGSTIDVNPAFEQLTGHRRTAAVHKPLLDLFHPPCVSSGFESFRRALGVGEPWRGRFAAARTDGHEYQVEATLAPISDETSEQPTLLCIVRDISEELRLASQLRQTQKLEALGTLAGGIAHDFNNILGTMMGFTELTMLDVPPASAQYEQLEQVMIAGERARSLVEQILTFSRRRETELLPFHIQPVVKETLGLLRSTIDRRIELVSRVSSDELIVTTDPTQIQQIVMNLCANAAHAIHDNHGTITVAVDRCDGPHNLGPCAVLSVTDTGDGMPADVAERIFEPFFTTKPVGEGTGMGLAVVHGIVEGHHGTIEVESTPGKGSTFAVYLPLTVEQPVDIVEETPRAVPPACAERILVVDDDPGVARSVAGLLGRLGYTTDAVTSPEAALEQVVTEPFSVDLVITDLAMPRMTGPELAARLHSVRSELPIVMLTGHSRNISVTELEKLGICRMLLKPVRSDQLALAIHELLHPAESVVAPWLEEADEVSFPATVIPGAS